MSTGEDEGIRRTNSLGIPVVVIIGWLLLALKLP
jgi:hypothetical protein